MTNRMFDTKTVAPTTKTTIAARVATKYNKYVQDTKEDMSYLDKLHEAKRDELFTKRSAIIANMKR